MPNDYTKGSIKSAFICLLNERPLNKISVRNIVDLCDISRNTFYYHFRDIPSLLEEIIIDAANTLIREHPTVLSMEECIETAYTFVKDNRRAVYHIYDSVDRDAYENFLMKMCEHTSRLLVTDVLRDRNASDEDKEALMYFMKCQFFGLCMDWTKSGMNDDIVEKYRRTVRLLSRVPQGIFQEKKS